jgi:hypothetical protein
VSRTVRGTRVIVAGVLAAGLLPTAAPAHGTPSDLDGPGSYLVVRTYPQTAGPSAEQNAACDDYFGPQRSATVALRQNAVQFAPKVQRASGLATDESVAFLGTGYICGAPAANQDLTEVFAIADVPAGRATMHGPCRVSPLQLVRAAPFLGCRLTVDPIPRISVGGHAVSNTVAGSIFVGYLVRDPKRPLPYTAPPAEPSWQPLPNDPDFYLWRTFNARTGPSTDCLPGGTGASSAALSATQPDLRTGMLDPDEPLRKAGKVTLCHTRSGKVTAVVEIQRAGRTVQLQALGDCRTEPTRAGRHLLMQTCVLDVAWADSPLFRAGQLTSIGLVRADNPQVAANSHIWTLGILDGETGAA